MFDETSFNQSAVGQHKSQMPKSNAIIIVVILMFLVLLPETGTSISSDL